MAYYDQHLLSIWKKQLHNQSVTWNNAGGDMVNPLEGRHDKVSSSSSKGIMGSESLQQLNQQQQSEEPFNVSLLGEESSLRVLVIALLACVLLFGIIGNLYAIYIFKTKSRSGFKGLRRQLALLASVDLISSLALPSLLIYLITPSNSPTGGGRWIFGDFSCSVFPAFHQAIITCVEGILMLVTYEKYTIIEKPFYQQKLPSHNILTWCFLIAFTAILISIPEASSFSFMSDGERCLVTGSSSLQLASASIYLVRDLLALTLTFYLVRKTGMLVKRNCIANSPHAVQLSSAKRRSKIVWILVVSTFVLVLPGDVYNVVRQCIYQQQYHHQEKLLFASGILLLIQICRSCSSFIAYSCMHPEFVKRWWCLLSSDGGCYSIKNSRSMRGNSSKNIVIDVVADIKDCHYCGDFRSGDSFSSISTPQNHHKRLLLPASPASSSSSSPYQHRLIVNMKDEYLNCLTETSSCSSSMF